MRRTLFILVGIAVVVTVGFVLNTFREAGEFKAIKPHFSGKCQAIEGVLSSEDITVYPQRGLAFISSDDRRPWFHGTRGRQGAIYGYDLNAPTPRLINLTAGFKQEFHPHGIGLYVSPEGQSLLFVVNHRTDGEFIEIFEFRDGRLIHKRSVSGELMTSPNDVIPVAPDKFYVTNDHGSTSKLGRALEDYLQLARSFVLYYDGRRFRRVAEGIRYANGIAVSPDGTTVYVASTLGQEILVYDRDLKSGALRLRREIPLGTGADNIELDDKGRLWIGAHQKLLTFVRYAKDPSKVSPSQVIMVDPHKRTPQIKEVYLNDGRPISGSSVACFYRGRLLVGSVFDPRFLVCELAMN